MLGNTAGPRIPVRAFLRATLGPGLPVGATAPGDTPPKLVNCSHANAATPTALMITFLAPLSEVGPVSAGLTPAGAGQ